MASHDDVRTTISDLDKAVPFPLILKAGVWYRLRGPVHCRRHSWTHFVLSTVSGRWLRLFSEFRADDSVRPIRRGLASPSSLCRARWPRSASRGKGYLRTKKERGNRIYSPRAQPRRVMRDLIDDFMDRLFDGEAMPLLQHVILDRGLSDEEIEQSRAFIYNIKY